jgi:hypothetical protein
MKTQSLLWFVILGLALHGRLHAQEESPADAAVPSTNKTTADKSTTSDQINQTLQKTSSQVEDGVRQIATTIDQDPNAKTASAGILQPIYVVAEYLAFPAFHWLAFTLMTAGVVSYTLQLLLGKLVLLLRLGFSLREIISDAAGLAISVFGLVLTTQASAENSSFTRSPAAVISATAVGLVVGIILYLWGQTQELQAAAGRSATAPKGK